MTQAGSSRRHTGAAEDHGGVFVADVQRAVRDGGYDVVFGGGEDRVAGLATYRDDVPAVVAHPSAEAVDIAL